MTTAFYERFSDKTHVEAFSADAVFTQFSKTDDDYTGCDGSTPSEGTEVAYKEKCDYKPDNNGDVSSWIPCYITQVNNDANDPEQKVVKIKFKNKKNIQNNKPYIKSLINIIMK
jgi:hypothetical protein